MRQSAKPTLADGGVKAQESALTDFFNDTERQLRANDAFGLSEPQSTPEHQRTALIP
jgi:hypothetical protein